MRASELARRRESLRMRAAAQRRELAYSAGQIEQRLSRFDGVLLTARQLPLKPLLIGVGIAAIALVGPRRLVTWATRGALVSSTAQRLLKRPR